MRDSLFFFSGSAGANVWVHVDAGHYALAAVFAVLSLSLYLVAGARKPAS